MLYFCCTSRTIWVLADLRNSPSMVRARKRWGLMSLSARGTCVDSPTHSPSWGSSQGQCRSWHRWDLSALPARFWRGPGPAEGGRYCGRGALALTLGLQVGDSFPEHQWNGLLLWVLLLEAVGTRAVSGVCSPSTPRAPGLPMVRILTAAGRPQTAGWAEGAVVA